LAELVDARDSKSRGGNTVPVRFRHPAPKEKALAISPVPFLFWFSLLDCAQNREPIFVAPHKRQ
jgi:hypothetical protein